MKDKMIEYFRNFLIQYDWCDKSTKEQARSIFSALCLMCYIDADTNECDMILSDAYNDAMIYELAEFDDLAEYDNFKNYMIKLIR